MKRFMRILVIAGFSSVYLMQGTCTFPVNSAANQNGLSIIPTQPSLLVNLLNGLGT